MVQFPVTLSLSRARDASPALVKRKHQLSTVYFIQITLLLANKSDPLRKSKIKYNSTYLI